MRRISKTLPALLLALCLLAGTALTAGEASLAAGFRQSGQFYGFVQTDELPSGLRLLADRLSLPVNSQPQRLSESGLPVFYLLLVDCSTSMWKLRSQVEGFTAALAGADAANARFALATFGEAFSLEWEGGVQEGDISSAVSKIGYTAQRTDLSQGILDAMDYLTSRPRRTGELVNLVVITDGIPKYSEDSPSLEEVSQALEGELSVLVHTCGLHTGKSIGGSAEALRSLETLGRGLHTTTEDGSAGTRGRSLADFVNSLCAVRFAWGDQNRGGVDIFLLWGDAGEQDLPVDMDETPVLDTAPEPPDGADGGEDPDASGDPPEEGPEDPGGAPAEDTEDQNAEEPDAPEAPGDPEDPASPEDPGAPGLSGTDITAAPGRSGVHWAVWAAAGVLCAAAAAAAVLVRRRGGGTSAQEGIFMRLEVISGSYAGSGELYLTDELVVGRGGKCDIPWKDREIAPRSARIFLRDNMICIEDLGSPQGTALGGMRLHGPNRLRSGDEISIGPVRFRLKF